MSGLLLRHAQTLWSAQERWQGPETDIPLAEAGRIAASRLRVALPEFARQSDTTVLSSPLRRCIETARLASGHHDVSIMASLAEISGSDLVGLTREEIRIRDSEFDRAWFAGELPNPPGDGEGVDMFKRRIAAAAESLRQRRDDWIAVTHAGVIHAAADHAGLPPEPVATLTGLLFEAGDGWSRWAAQSVDATSLRVGVGADHYGLGLLEIATKWLKDHGYEVIDYTPATSGGEIDYPGVAIAVASEVQVGNVDRGVLICGTGIGMSISANAVADVRAACVADPYSAQRAQASNDAQILTFGEQVVGPAIVPLLLEAWMSAQLENDRSLRKVTTILEYESSVRPPHQEV